MAEQNRFSKPIPPYGGYREHHKGLKKYTYEEKERKYPH